MQNVLGVKIGFVDGQTLFIHIYRRHRLQSAACSDGSLGGAQRQTATPEAEPTPGEAAASAEPGTEREAEISRNKPCGSVALPAQKLAHCCTFKRITPKK